jgi:hypothetical protein
MGFAYIAKCLVRRKIFREGRTFYEKIKHLSTPRTFLRKACNFIDDLKEHLA